MNGGVGAISSVCRSYRGKNGRCFFCYFLIMIFMIPKLHNFMGRSPTRLYREKLWEMSEKPTNKSKHSQNNQFWSRSFRDERYPGKLRCKFTWNICSSICSHTTAIRNQTMINWKQMTIIEEAISNSNGGISSSRGGSKFSRQHSKLFAKS